MGAIADVVITSITLHNMILHDELAKDLENIDEGNSDNPFPIQRVFTVEDLQHGIEGSNEHFLPPRRPERAFVG
jgi:hypothetical protein